MKWLTFLAAVTFMTGCAHRETVALLPGAGEASGSLNVRLREGGQVTLTKPYESAKIQGGGVAAGQLPPEDLKEKFAAALDARPQKPARFVLYFVEGSDRLTPESEQQIAGVFAEIKNRPAPDVVVVGHTDRVGSLIDNDRLAQRRADKIRGSLIQQGLEGDNVVAVGRGEREPMVVTEDEVAEPRNRRVEILVR